MKKRILIVVIAVVVAILLTTDVHAADFIYANDVYAMCEEICKPYHISPEFIQAIIWAESRYDADAKNGACTGLMQINPKWHRERMERLGVDDITDPYNNILVGTDYIAELFEETDDDYLVLMTYNMGKAKASKRYAAGKYTEYAEDVCDTAIVLEIEHGK